MGQGRPWSHGWQTLHPAPPNHRAQGPSDILDCPRSGPTAHLPSPYLKPEVHLHQRSLLHWEVGEGAHLS